MLYVLGLLAVALLGAGLYVLVQKARQESDREPPRHEPSVSPQELAVLSMPYRGLLGEAVAVESELASRAAEAPPVLRSELLEITSRVSRLVKRALPRAVHGTELTDFLLRLTPQDPEYEANTVEAARIEAELTNLAEQLRRVRGKVYGIISNAHSMSADRRLQTDLDDAVSDISMLEEAMNETIRETEFLS